MAVPSLNLPAQNPAFDFPDCAVVRYSGRTLTEAHHEHSEQPDNRIECVILADRKTAANLFP